MESKFDPGSADRIFERLAEDQTGELRKLVGDIIDKCKQASKLGVPLDELATFCTMGWQMGSDPSIEKMLDFLMSTSGISNDVVN